MKQNANGVSRNPTNCVFVLSIHYNRYQCHWQWQYWHTRCHVATKKIGQNIN